jgi:hypothetical protein
MNFRLDCSQKLNIAMDTGRGTLPTNILKCLRSRAGSTGSSAWSTGAARPRIKDNKTIRVADEDAPEEYRGQQSIFLRR